MNYRITADDESEEIWKEAVVDYINTQSQHSLTENATFSTVLSIIPLE
jgi:hypothetical protein